MKIFSIIGLAAIVALFLIAPAGAALVPVVNYDFSTDQWVNSSTYSGQTGWVESGAWKIKNDNALILEAGSSTKSGYFGQVIPFAGGAGPITLSFDTTYLKTVGTNATVTIYGSTTSPVSGSNWSNAGAFGTPLGSSEFTAGGDQVNWVSKDLHMNAGVDFSWFTIIFYGSIPGDAGQNTARVMVDNIRLDVTPASTVPISPTVWLLGAGLLSLVAIRRRLQN
jgi:hypothetical protein